jgi:release factor glutamine methyltransferase
MVIKDIIKKLEQDLDRNEVFIILEYVLERNKTKILLDLDEVLTEKQEEKIENILQRRLNKEPLQYILCEQFFYKNKFFVNENVLIPREDTEVLIDEVLKNTNDNSEVLDLCTGSGCIAITLKKSNESLNVTASDISENALMVAMINSLINKTKINFIKSDLFEKIDKKFDVIVSDPPYIETADVAALQEEVKKEPILALDGGADGLKFYREIIKKSKAYLRDNGIIALEIGYNQAKAIREILQDNGFDNIKVIKDYGNNDRVLIANKL